MIIFKGKKVIVSPDGSSQLTAAFKSTHLTLPDFTAPAYGPLTRKGNVHGCTLTLAKGLIVVIGTQTEKGRETTLS